MKMTSENSLMTVSQKRKYDQDDDDSKYDSAEKIENISQGKRAKIIPDRKPIIKDEDNATREFTELMEEIDRMPKYDDMVKNKTKQNRNNTIQGNTNIAIQQNVMIKQNDNTKSKLKAIQSEPNPNSTIKNNTKQYNKSW